MKTLYLIRHAKAEEHSSHKADFDRNLQEKGKQRAIRIANKLAQNVIVNEKTLVISSSANRAIQTATIFCDIINYPTENIQQTKSIYEAHFTDILKVINAVSDQMDTLFVFGHNPGLSNLTNYLSHDSIDLATSNVAILELEEGINFTMLAGGTANLLTVMK